MNMPKIMQSFATFVVKCDKTMEKAFSKLRRAFDSVYSARPFLDEIRQYRAQNVQCLPNLWPKYDRRTTRQWAAKVESEVKNRL